MDYLGEGLSVFDYENLMHEIQEISSNNDIKNELLDKFRQKFRNEKLKLEKEAHSFSQILELVKEEESKHESLLKRKTLMRNRLEILKSQKNILREEINKLSQKSGILTRMPLMKNYDKISSEIEKLAIEISSIEEINEKLLIKVEASKLMNEEFQKPGLTSTHRNVGKQEFKITAIDLT